MIVLDASAVLELILNTEALGGPLLTCDGPLSRTPGAAKRVELVQAPQEREP